MPCVHSFFYELACATFPSDFVTWTYTCAHALVCVSLAQDTSTDKILLSCLAAAAAFVFFIQAKNIICRVNVKTVAIKCQRQIIYFVKVVSRQLVIFICDTAFYARQWILRNRA